MSDLTITFTLKVGDYEIYVLDKDSIWIQHKDGEGMSVWNKEFYELIDNYFKDNF